MIKRMCLIFTLAITGCGGSSDGGSGVSGINMTGYYNNARITCVQSVSPFNITKTADVAASNFFTITGNNYQSSLLYNGCGVTINANIVFVDESTYEISNINVTEATGGSCSIATGIVDEVGSGGAIIGLPTVTYNEGLDPSPTLSNVYGFEDNEISIFAPTITTSGSSPADYCFFTYDKTAI